MKNIGVGLLLALSPCCFSAPMTLKGVDTLVWNVNDAAQSVLDQRARQLQRAAPTATTVYLANQGLLVLVSPLSETRSNGNDLPATKLTTQPINAATDQRAARDLAHAERSLIEKERSIQKKLQATQSQDQDQDQDQNQESAELEQRLKDNRQQLAKIAAQRADIKKATEAVQAPDGRAAFYQALSARIITEICQRLPSSKPPIEPEMLTLVLQAGGVDTPQGHATQAWQFDQKKLKDCAKGEIDIHQLTTDVFSYQY